MRVRRPQLSIFFALCAVILLVSIAVGQRMGDRVLGQVTSRGALQTLPTPYVAPSESAAPNDRNWKKAQVITAATDPGFPDPRVVAPPPTPRPRTPEPATPTPLRTATPAPIETSAPTAVPTALRSDPGAEPTNENGRPSVEPAATAGRSAGRPPDGTPTPDSRPTYVR